MDEPTPPIEADPAVSAPVDPVTQSGRDVFASDPSLPWDQRVLEALQIWTAWFIAVAAALVVGWIIHRVAWAVVLRATRGARVRDAADSPSLAEVAARSMRRPSCAAIVLLAVRTVMPMAPASGASELIAHLLSIGLLAALTWLVIGLVEAFESVVTMRYSIDVSDNLTQRKIQTQTRVLVRALQILIAILGAAAILMTFPAIRQFGTSLLASAGLAGLVVGLAARPVVANLIAGVQIALTQPLRLDDVVVIGGEWGRVEEITSTYVVVKIWDERRLIVPLAKIIEEPFENWTRTSSSVLGTVTMHTDIGTSLDGLRAELKRLCEATDQWDKRVCILQVTEAQERTMVVRALMSATDSGRLWNLRCAVREGLLRYIQDRDATALPRIRTIMHRAPAAPNPPASADESLPA